MKKNYDTHGMTVEEIKQKTEEAKQIYKNLEKMLENSQILLKTLKKKKQNGESL